MKNLDLLLKKYRNPLLAFSGGADSTFLYLKMKENCLKFTPVSLIMPNTSQNDLENIRKYETIKINFSPLGIKEFRENSKERCYFCKKAIFSELNRLKEKYNCDAVFDGTNRDDRNFFRPGAKAKEEMGIVSPLAECGISKKEILEELKKRGYEYFKSDSCYATRIAYGEEITEKKLTAVKETEIFLHKIGINICRASLTGNLMRIDVPEEEQEKIFAERKKIVSFVRNSGINFVTLDLEGYVSGKQDR